MADLGALTDDLRTLGHASEPVVDADLLAARVVGALPAAPGTARPRVRRRVALAALAVLVALVATPPVRAAVAEWLGFGAVRVEPGDAPTGRPDVPELGRGPSVAEAAQQAGFPLYVPTALGEPDGVEVADDGRRVSMSWGSGADTVRLDQLAGTLDFTVVKQAPRLQFATVDGSDVLWLPTAHRVALLDTDGEPAGSFRVADRTMLVPRGESTLRLEGPLTFAEAADLARSLQAVG
jgi:hypothetical protein